MAHELLSDPWTLRYNPSSIFHTFYTCVPVDKQQTSYECVKGGFDPLYSDALRPKSKDWITATVPWYIPQASHEAWLNGKFKDTLVRLYKGPDPWLKIEAPK